MRVPTGEWVTTLQQYLTHWAEGMATESTPKIQVKAEINNPWSKYLWLIRRTLQQEVLEMHNGSKFVSTSIEEIGGKGALVWRDVVTAAAEMTKAVF